MQAEESLEQLEALLSKAATVGPWEKMSLAETAIELLRETLHGLLDRVAALEKQGNLKLGGR